MATYDETVENKTTQEVMVPPKATRRVLSPSCKARILKEYDACPQRGKGALLRREGLLSSQIT
jgi:transposase